MGSSAVVSRIAPFACDGFHRPVSSRALRAVERLCDSTLAVVIGCSFTPERKDEFAGGVVGRHHDVHFLERFAAAHLGGALDRFQIQRGTGIADPVFVARIIEPDSGMS